MKAKCKNMRGTSDVEPFALSESAQRTHLSVGEEYLIYGVGVLNGKAVYLVQGTLPYPDFVPTSCFDPPVGTLPAGLKMVLNSTPGAMLCMLTGGLLARSGFYDALVGGDHLAEQEWQAFKCFVHSQHGDLPE
jgi:hypothetical protein